MKSFLLVLVGIVFGVLGNTVVVDHLRPVQPRQFVILITPSGPVYGEAPANEDVLSTLHKLFDSVPHEGGKESTRLPMPHNAL